MLINTNIELGPGDRFESNVYQAVSVTRICEILAKQLEFLVILCSIWPNFEPTLETFVPLGNVEEINVVQ